MARGQPDEATYQPQVQPEDLPRKIVPEMSGVSFGGGITQLANTAEQVNDAIDKKYQADSATFANEALAQRRRDAIQQMETQKANLPAGDPGDFAGNYIKGFDKDNEALLKVANESRNPYVSGMVNKGLTDLRDTLFDHAKQWEAQTRVAYRADSLQSTLQSQLPAVEAHPEIATQVGSSYMDTLNSIGIEPAKRLPLARQMHEQLSEAAANGLTRQNPQGMLNSLNDPNNVSPELKGVISGLNNQQREAVLAKAKGQIAGVYANSVIGAFRTQGPDIGNKAMLSIDSINQPDDIKEQIRAKVEQGVSQWHQESRSAQTSQITALESRIASGDAGESDKATAWGLYNKGALDTNQIVSTIGSITRSQQKGQDDKDLLQFATNAYQQQTKLDPKDTRTKNGVDLLFTNMTKGVAPGTPGYNNAVTDMVSRVGIVPASAENYARANLTSGSPQAAAGAAQMLAHIQATNPRAEMFAEDSKLKAMASTINDAVKAGTDAIAAVTLARSNAALSEAETKTLTDQFNTKLISHQANALNSILKGDPNFKPGTFSSLPAVPLTMQTDFNTLTSDYFKHTNGNITQSRQLAVQDLKNTWGVTEVNGKREFMQYAPEAMHPGLTTEALRSDIETSAAGLTADPSKVHLVANARTPYTNGEQWNLGAPDKFGAYNVLTDSRGIPFVYKIPDARAVWQASRDKAAAAGMARLHEMQLNTAGAAESEPVGP
jgi:hypothetical protein